MEHFTQLASGVFHFASNGLHAFVLFDEIILGVDFEICLLNMLNMDKYIFSVNETKIGRKSDNFATIALTKVELSSCFEERSGHSWSKTTSLPKFEWEFLATGIAISFETLILVVNRTFPCFLCKLP